ncbi:tetratricopeptide repeat protein (macronuclear) [Tetrahymena thermophila SB210]|uniref:Tetratricopeptide repeat protein n=1 Tax=Tetrahymena thermophila (strain SB210) TaxID=312017 RepID=W7XCR9_TETTS|nr:tetratricopeptide repeat protein [Tetrahymena thermophila SB210]EWS74338.1 tetratricopeptide repeat protein [Tetrahymena thermophila SB210]|eukprot:XP_012653159.1 tetratricopeptide repeat protein [Tetrahymena thermophila SB210]
MMDSLKQFGQQILYSQSKGKQQISQEQALLQSIFLSQNQTVQDIVQLTQINNQNSKQLNNEDFELKRMKLMLIFSKQQNQKQNDMQQLLHKIQMLDSFQKIKVFHMKQSMIIDSTNQSFQYKNLIYESFSDENKFVSNVLKQRNNKDFKEEYEYITILNNS